MKKKSSARKDSKGRVLRSGERERKDGSYEYRYINPINKKRESVYANELSVLRQMEKDIQRDIDDGIQSDTKIKKISLNSMFDMYLKICDASAQTKANYRKMWDNLVKERLGCGVVVAIRTSHIKAFYAWMNEEEYSHSTVKYIHGLICPTLELAVDDNIIRKNPSKIKIKGYGIEPKKKEALTQQQQDTLLNFVYESPVYFKHYPLIAVMLGCAGRVGEVIGLTWSDIILKSGKININHQLIYKNLGDGCQFYATSPKTDAGNRTIPMTKAVRKAFDIQRELQFAQKIPRDIEIDGFKDFIFTTKNGRPMMPSAVNNVLYNVVTAYNEKEKKEAAAEKREPFYLPKFSAHVLRHTGCTRMAEAGIEPKALQYIMGHSKISMTLDVYTHITDNQQIEQQMTKMENRMVV